RGVCAFSLRAAPALPAALPICRPRAPVGREHLRAPGTARVDAADGGDPLTLDEHVGPRRTVGGDDLAAAEQHRVHRTVPRTVLPHAQKSVSTASCTVAVAGASTGISRHLSKAAPGWDSPRVTTPPTASRGSEGRRKAC